jgi:hypothetical protein
MNRLLLAALAVPAAASIAVVGGHALTHRTEPVARHTRALPTASPTPTPTATPLPLPIMPPAQPIITTPSDECAAANLRLTLSAPVTRVAPASSVKLVATVRNTSAQVCALEGGLVVYGPTCSPTTSVPGPWVQLRLGDSVNLFGLWFADTCSRDARTSWPAQPGRYTVTVSVGPLGTASIVITVLNETPVPAPSYAPGGV